MSSSFSGHNVTANDSALVLSIFIDWYNESKCGAITIFISLFILCVCV